MSMIKSFTSSGHISLYLHTLLKFPYEAVLREAMLMARKKLRIKLQRFGQFSQEFLWRKVYGTWEGDACQFCENWNSCKFVEDDHKKNKVSNVLDGKAM
ncbi:hypothetical protein L6452_14244 [Arctium lappa]|uniref:Uncharacterized protein n=1 Tax=Arctium lappa TaxID=4217 RepID=A0ACB9CKQ9_ARCLA|nr:hypothetical protein L6452_14244 [Arctium lappa]